MASLREFADADALFAGAAARFAALAREAVDARGRFTVALAGGSTPRALYRLLAGMPLPWGAMHFFWGDERHVAPDHADSNFRMACEALLARSRVPAANVHRIRGELAATAAAELYAAELERFFGARLPRFDLVLLGMGGDGHTASIFPGTRAVGETRSVVVANWVEKLAAERITLTAPALNHAAHVMFLVSGADKSAVLREVIEGPFDPDRLPAQLIRPESGACEWFVDRAAAGELRENALGDRSCAS